jgi:hypothetical protein
MAEICRGCEKDIKMQNSEHLKSFRRKRLGQRLMIVRNELCKESFSNTVN